MEAYSGKQFVEIDRVWLFWSDVGERVLMRPVPRTGRAAWH